MIPRSAARLVAIAGAGALLCWSVGVGAAAKYLALEPGVSTKADAARVLGEPVFAMGDILLEYKPREGTGPIFAELRSTGDIVDRIEVRVSPRAPRATLAAALSLPSAASATRKDRSGALLEYYAGAALMLSYSGPDASSEIVAVTYYSDAAFAKQVDIVQSNASGTPAPPTTSVPTPPSPSTPSPGSFPGPAGTPPAPATLPAPVAPTVPPPNAIAPSVTRDPLACYSLFTWSRTEEEDAKRAKQTDRRQLAMDIRISSQAGDCERARALSDKYKRLYPGRGIK